MRWRIDFSKFSHRLLGAVAVTAAMILVGTVGFALMHGWSVSDAFFMTVITVSAVGYGEIQPVATAGERLFTTFLIGGGIVTLAIWFALITATLVELNVAQVFRRRMTTKSIQRLRGHVIVCGVGRTGRHVIRRYLAAGTPLVAIDSDPAQLARARELDPGLLLLEGDATSDAMLEAAGIRRARALVAALSADADNAFACLAANDLNPELTIVGRARSDGAAAKLRKAGATRVVTPSASGGAELAALALRPDMPLFLDLSDGGTAGGAPDLLMESVPIGEDSDLAGLTLAEAALPAKVGLLVVAISRGRSVPAGEDDFLYNPGPEERLRPGDHVVSIGPPARIDRLRRLLG